MGPARSWTRDEETFAYLMSNFVALALEREPISTVRSVRRPPIAS